MEEATDIGIRGLIIEKVGVCTGCNPITVGRTKVDEKLMGES